MTVGWRGDRLRKSSYFEETNMNTNKTEFEVTVEKSVETLWEDFEKTGSVKTYLLFLQKAQNQEETEPLNPFLSLS